MVDSVCVTAVYAAGNRITLPEYRVAVNTAALSRAEVSNTSQQHFFATLYLFCVVNTNVALFQQNLKFNVLCILTLSLMLTTKIKR